MAASLRGRHIAPGPRAGSEGSLQRPGRGWRGPGGCGSLSAHFRARCHLQPVTCSPLSRGRWGLGGGSARCLLSVPAAASQEPVSMAGQCDTIYKGFAECLLSLGESMAQSVRQQQQEEGGDEAQELDAICK